jgi:RNA polymerase sigma-70 factor (ECF subfamily)
MREDPAAVRARDVALLERIRQGDERALTELAHVYMPSLNAVATSVLGSSRDTEDILQEVLFSLWDSRATLVISDNVAGYLYRAVRNRALNLIHQQNAQRRREEHVMLGDSDTARLSWTAADAELDEQDVNHQLQSALSRVSPSIREVFLLSWTGLTYEEIAGVLGITRGSVRTQMYRATQQLARFFRRPDR